MEATLSSELNQIVNSVALDQVLCVHEEGPFMRSRGSFALIISNKLVMFIKQNHNYIWNFYTEIKVDVYARMIYIP